MTCTGRRWTQPEIAPTPLRNTGRPWRWIPRGRTSGYGWQPSWSGIRTGPRPSTNIARPLNDQTQHGPAPLHENAQAAYKAAKERLEARIAAMKASGNPAAAAGVK